MHSVPLFGRILQAAQPSRARLGDALGRHSGCRSSAQLWIRVRSRRRRWLRPAAIAAAAAAASPVSVFRLPGGGRGRRPHTQTRTLEFARARARARTHAALRAHATRNAAGGGGPPAGGHTHFVSPCCVSPHAVCVCACWGIWRSGLPSRRETIGIDGLVPEREREVGGGGIWAPTRRETVGMRKVCVWRRLASTGLPPRLPPRKDKEDRRGSRCYN